MPDANRAGLFIGPVLALVAYALIPDAAHGGLDHGGRATVAVAVWMAVWWMTEAIPLAATSLIPMVAFPLTGALPANRALAPYASDIIFLFMGGFMIGLAMQRWDLHRRIALGIVRAVGTSPSRLVAGFMLATASLSLWISNTASAVMLLPVGMSVIQLLERHVPHGDRPQLDNLATCLMLGIAYAASIGGMGTLIGSPPNLVFANFARTELGTEVTMLDWMRIGIPLVLVMLPATWLLLTRVLHPLRLTVPPEARGHIHDELRGLGPVTRGERVVAAVFACAALAWILRPQLARLTGLPDLTDTTIAMAGALALFIIPVDWKEKVFALDWHTAKELPWGVLLLFGGGLSLSVAIGANGVDTWLASGFETLQGVHPIVVLVAVTTLVVFLTELSSNTAVANTVMPVLAAVALGLHTDALPLLIAAAFAASCAFMLPVATPPNAIVFASGAITIKQMVRAGLGLNFIAIAVITGLVYLL